MVSKLNTFTFMHNIIFKALSFLLLAHSAFGLDVQFQQFSENTKIEKCEKTKGSISEKSIALVLEQLNHNYPDDLQIKELKVLIFNDCRSGGDAIYESTTAFKNNTHTLILGTQFQPEYLKPLLSHELAHPIFFEYLKKSSDLKIRSCFTDEVSEKSSACLNLHTEILPYSELYSDLISQLENPFEDISITFNHLLQSKEKRTSNFRDGQFTARTALRSFTQACDLKSGIRLGLIDTYSVSCPSRKKIWSILRSMKNQCSDQKVRALILEKLVSAFQKINLQNPVLQFFKMDQIQNFNKTLLEELTLQNECLIDSEKTL